MYDACVTVVTRVSSQYLTDTVVIDLYSVYNYVNLLCLIFWPAWSKDRSAPSSDWTLVGRWGASLKTGLPHLLTTSLAPSSDHVWMNFFLQIKTNFIYCKSYSLLLKAEITQIKNIFTQNQTCQKHLLTLHIRNLLHNLQYSLIQA